MTIEYEDDFEPQRAHSRRWVSIIAFVIPVAAFVLLVAWFVRVYIVPPTVDIPGLIRMAAAPAEPPAPVAEPKIGQPPAPTTNIEPPPAAKPPAVKADLQQPAGTGAAPIIQRAATEQREPAAPLPVFATLAAAPPMAGSAPPAFTDPTQDAPAAAAANSAALETATPIAGPIPLPRTRPHSHVAFVATTAVPLPLPRPAESTPLPPPDLPSVDRHAVD